jgi:hypothetical protein
MADSLIKLLTHKYKSDNKLLDLLNSKGGGSDTQLSLAGTPPTTKTVSVNGPLKPVKQSTPNTVDKVLGAVANYANGIAQTFNIPVESVIRQIQGKKQLWTDEQISDAASNAMFLTGGMVEGSPVGLPAGVSDLLGPATDQIIAKGADVAGDLKAGAQDVVDTTRTAYNTSPLSSETGAIGDNVSNLSRDMRFKQGNPQFRPNTNPEVPTYATTQDAPATGFTPEELAQQRAAQVAKESPSKPNTQTEIPSYNPPDRGTDVLGEPGAVHIPVSSDVNTAAKQVTAQNAVDNIPGTTATEKFTNLRPRITELSNQINAYNAANPVNIPESQIKDSIVDQIKPFIAPEGTDLVEAHGRGLITSEEAKIMANDTVRQLKLQAGIDTPTIDSQSGIPIDQITKMKQGYNQLYGPILAKRAAGGNLTGYEQIQLASRDGLDAIMPKGVKDLSMEQSGLYNAEAELGKQANVDYKTAQAAANTPKENPITSLLKGSVSSIPHAAASAGVLAGLGIGGYGVWANAQIPKNYQFGSGNVTIPPVTDIKDSAGNQLVVNPTDYQNQIADLNKQKQSYQTLATLGVPEAKTAQANIDTQIKTLTSKLNTMQPIYNQYTDTSNIIQGLDEAQKAIKAANPTFLQAYGSLGGLLTGVRASIDPNYATFVQKLNNLHQMYGLDVSNIINSGSRQSADAAISATVQDQINRLKNTVKNSGGVWPGEAPKTGGELLKNMIQQTNNPPPTTPPTEQTTAQPTPDAFQNMLQGAMQGR